MTDNNEENEILKKKVQKLFQENSGLADEVRDAQENVRLSSQQQSIHIQLFNQMAVGQIQPIPGIEWLLC